MSDNIVARSSINRIAIIIGAGAAISGRRRAGRKLKADHSSPFHERFTRLNGVSHVSRNSKKSAVAPRVAGRHSRVVGGVGYL
ncbi:MAG: hypothetical protein WAK31_05510 [Chthoniobacterales bacterium]